MTGLQADGVDGANHLLLLAAVADDQALQPDLLDHHGRRRHLAAAAR